MQSLLFFRKPSRCIDLFILICWLSIPHSLYQVDAQSQLAIIWTLFATCSMNCLQINGCIVLCSRALSLSAFSYLNLGITFSRYSHCSLQICDSTSLCHNSDGHCSCWCLQVQNVTLSNRLLDLNQTTCLAMWVFSVTLLDQDNVM